MSIKKEFIEFDYEHDKEGKRVIFKSKLLDYESLQNDYEALKEILDLNIAIKVD